MKNRGYAMSAIVYPILLISLILVVSLLFNYQNKQALLGQLKNEVQNNYNVNSGILWKTWLLKTNPNYYDYESLQEALSDDIVSYNVFNSTNATAYLKQNPVLVSFIKELPNYKNELVDIILSSTTLSNEEKYKLGLPCYISNGTTFYSSVGNGYSMTNKVEPLVNSNSACTALFDSINSAGYRLISNCKGTIPYIYSNNYVDLTNYDNAYIDIEYYRNCTSLSYTVTSNFGFSKTKGLANSNFDKNYTFNFNNASSTNEIGGANHSSLNYNMDISTLSGNYYYKHYLVNNITTTDVCSGYNIIKRVYLY